MFNFDSLIAETTQVPGTWQQDLGLCESQAETHKPVSVASMAMWKGGDNEALQEGLPDSSPSTDSSDIYFGATPMCQTRL